MMQAFALDHSEMISASDVTTIGGITTTIGSTTSTTIALPTTGFFTSKYTVLDVTADLDVS